jgi:phasin family protein
MAKTTNGTNGFFDMSKVFADFRVPGLDVEAIVQTQRKNFEAITQANEIAVEGVRALAQRQAEIVQQAVADASTLFRDWTEAGATDDRIAKGAEAAKRAFEKGLANVRELNELGSRATADAFSVLARRVSESFDEVRLYAKKQAAAE